MLIRANKPHFTKGLQRLSAAGDDGDDILDLVELGVQGLGAGYHREEREAEGWRVKSSVRRSRVITLSVNKGPAGITGETYDTETEESVETTTRHAQLSQLRAMIAIPENSYYGLLFVERIGVRHLRKIVEQHLLFPVGRQIGVTLRLESFAESRDWRTLLAPQDVLRVSELLHDTRSGDDASTPADLKVRIETTGGRLRRYSGQIKEAVLGRVEARESRLDAAARYADLDERRERYEWLTAQGAQIASADAFTVSDYRELEDLNQHLEPGVEEGNPEIAEALAGFAPVDPDAGLEHDHYEVELGQGNRTETRFIVERDRMPQFVYELGGWLSDSGLRQTWISDADRIFKNRGVTLPKNWSKRN